MLTIGIFVSRLDIRKHPRFGAMPESLVIKWLRSSLHLQRNSSNVVPLPLSFSLSRKVSSRNAPRILSNGRGNEVGEFRIQSTIEEFTSADSFFRRGRTPVGRTRGSSIRMDVSERTSMVGCETRKAPSSTEIKWKPNRVSSRRDIQRAFDIRGVAFTVFEWGFKEIIY